MTEPVRLSDLGPHERQLLTLLIAQRKAAPTGMDGLGQKKAAAPVMQRAAARAGGGKHDADTRPAA